MVIIFVQIWFLLYFDAEYNSLVSREMHWSEPLLDQVYGHVVVVHPHVSNKVAGLVHTLNLYLDLALHHHLLDVEEALVTVGVPLDNLDTTGCICIAI